MASKTRPFHGYEAIVSQADGEPPVIYPLDAGGGTVSFAWGRVGFRSSIWNVTATPKGDVYVSEQTMAKVTKLSLHLSGDWRNAWIRDQQTGQLTESGARFESLTGSRILDRWVRPEPTGAITHGVTIAVTHDDVQPWFNDLAIAGDVEWSDIPDEGVAGVITVLLVKPFVGALTMPMKGTVGLFGMDSGEVVWVVATELVMDDDEVTNMHSLRAKAAALVTDDELQALPPGEQPRSIFHSTPEQGHREIWDLAMPIRTWPGQQDAVGARRDTGSSELTGA